MSNHLANHRLNRIEFITTPYRSIDEIMPSFLALSGSNISRPATTPLSDRITSAINRHGTDNQDEYVDMRGLMDYGGIDRTDRIDRMETLDATLDATRDLTDEFDNAVDALIDIHQDGQDYQEDDQEQQKPRTEFMLLCLDSATELAKPFDCNICMETKTMLDRVVTNCGHEMCTSCMGTILKKHKYMQASCAFCRTAVKTVEIKDSEVEERWRFGKFWTWFGSAN